METASTFRYRSILARGSSRYLRSVTLVRILGVYDFDMGEWEETPPSVHLSLPLTADVHPCNLDDVTNLRKEGQEGETKEAQDLFVATTHYKQSYFVCRLDIYKNISNCSQDILLDEKI